MEGGVANEAIGDEDDHKDYGRPPNLDTTPSEGPGFPSVVVPSPISPQ